MPDNLLSLGDFEQGKKHKCDFTILGILIEIFIALETCAVSSSSSLSFSFILSLTCDRNSKSLDGLLAVCI